MAHDPIPVLPTVKISQIIRPHQPDELHVRVERAKGFYGRASVACAQPCLDIADQDAGMADQRARRRHAPIKRRRTLRLERIARRDQPPHAIQLKPFHRFGADMDMARMRRIKGPPEQTNHLSRRSKR